MNKFRKVFDHKWWLYDLAKWTNSPFAASYYRIKKIYAPGAKQKGMYKGRLIICANHMSYEDPAIIITGIWRRRVGFMAVKELFAKKRSRWFFQSIGCISVDRTNFDINSVKQSINTIDRGHTMCIFPEGRINKADELLPFKSGLVMTALLAKADILPVYIAKRHSRWCRQVIVIGKRLKLNELFKTPYPPIEEVDRVTDLLNEKERELQKIYEKQWFPKIAKKVKRIKERKAKKALKKANKKNKKGVKHVR